MLIVGEKEDNEGTVSVRKHGGEDWCIKIKRFIQHFTSELESLTKFNNNQWFRTIAIRRRRRTSKKKAHRG